MVCRYDHDAGLTHMVIIRLMGGLGNQMQQYALYRKFISLGREACLDISMYSDEGYRGTVRKLEIDRFPNVEYETASAEQISRIRGDGSIFRRLRNRVMPSSSSYIREKGMYMPEIFDRDDVYLEGYWSAEKYYADIMPSLREIYDFAPLLAAEGCNPAIGDMAERIAASDFPVSVHIRRGDYLSPENAALFGGISTEEYYASAFRYVKERHPEAEFFIFSDDPGYVREKYGDDASCVTVDVNHADDSMYDIYLMSHCIAHICANSSFSFWGARLDEHREQALCIRPSVHVNSQVFDPDVMRTLWAGWVFIDPQGTVRQTV